MLAVVSELDREGLECGEQPFPAEVDFVISAMEAGPPPVHDRHELKRSRYRVRAILRLFSDKLDSPATLLYTRNVNPQAIGFLSDRRLPLSHGGIIRMAGPDGRMMEIYCTVLRCREAAPGWFEGAVYFNRRQPQFAAEAMEQFLRADEAQELA